MATLTPEQIAYFELHASDDRRASIIVTDVVCLMAASIAVGLRFIARHLKKADIGPDDWCILLGLLFYFPTAIMYCFETRWGVGRHIIFVTNAYLISVVTLSSICLDTITLMINKLAVILLYRRVFPQRSFLPFLLFDASLVIGSGISGFFADLFTCTPISTTWNHNRGGHCVNESLLVLLLGILNIATDIIILATPMPVLWRLQLDRKAKWQLSGIFLLGGCVCIARIARLPYSKNVGANSPDPTWDEVPLAITSSVELSLGIISACLPTYKPLLNWILHGREKPSTSQQSHEMVYNRHIKLGSTTDHSEEHLSNLQE